MSEKTYNTRITHKHDTAENWGKAENFVPKAGELIIYDPDATNVLPRIKIGDGEKNISNLCFVIPTNISQFINDNGFITKDDLSEMVLFDSTANVTPIDVAQALISHNQLVILTHQDNTYGMSVFANFAISGALAAVVASTDFLYEDVLMHSELVGDINSGTWTLKVTEVAQKSDLTNLEESFGSVIQMMYGDDLPEGEDDLITIRDIANDAIKDKIPETDWEATHTGEAPEVFKSLSLSFNSTASYINLQSNKFTVQKDEEYIVHWNGKKYPCIVKTDKYGTCYLGNASLTDWVLGTKDNTREPFCLCASEFSTKQIYLVYKEAVAKETIELVITYKDERVYNKLPAEYLPDTAVRTVD